MENWSISPRYCRNLQLPLLRGLGMAHRDVVRGVAGLRRRHAGDAFVRAIDQPRLAPLALQPGKPDWRALVDEAGKRPSRVSRRSARRRSAVSRAASAWVRFCTSSRARTSAATRPAMMMPAIRISAGKCSSHSARCNARCAASTTHRAHKVPTAAKANAGRNRTQRRRPGGGGSPGDIARTPAGPAPAEREKTGRAGRRDPLHPSSCFASQSAAVPPAGWPKRARSRSACAAVRAARAGSWRQACSSAASAGRAVAGPLDVLRIHRLPEQKMLAMPR